jgi:hypothetical protein
VDQKHHLVPQFLLKRFASDGQLFLTDRDHRWRVLTSVERAGREGGFYTLGQEVLLPPETSQSVNANPPLMNILERRQDGRYILGPDSFEKMLSVVEDISSPAMDRLVNGQWPPNREDRLHLALFMAFQFTRGRTFREDIDGIFRATTRTQIERNPDYYRRRWQDSTRSEAKTDPLPDLIRGLDDLYLAQDNKLGLMASGAIELAPWLAARSWKLLCLDSPDFVISDEPVTLWTRRDRAQEQGVGTADFVYLPIDAWHCLQLARPDLNCDLTEARVPGVPKLRQANNAIASNAHRWIWFHPDCAVIDDLAVRRTRGKFRVETVARGDQRDLTSEIVRVYRERW